jgi:adenosylcobinamide-GDP ribazoletransferase
MKYLKGFLMAWGCFCWIPCPYKKWDEAARPAMLTMLPLLGACLGLLTGVIWTLLVYLGASSFLTGAVVTAAYFLMTGFIHLDGYMDACDALLSWRPLEKRLEILKDSHTGAFAVVGLSILVLFSYDAAGLSDLRPLLFVPVVSRCGSALAVLCLKPIGHSQYARLQATPGQKGAVVLAGLCAFIACALWLGDCTALIVEALAYAAALAWAYRNLGGVSGDVAGFALTLAECAALVALGGRAAG